MGDAYSHWTLPRIAGMSGAAEILLSGRTFDGNEAKELGVCSRVLPNDEVLPCALDLARDIAINTAPRSVARQQAIALGHVEPHRRRGGATGDGRPSRPHGARRRPRGRAAFLERRPPVWTGEPPEPEPGDGS